MDHLKLSNQAILKTEPLMEYWDYLPYNDDDIDYIYNRAFDDVMTDIVDWNLFPKILLKYMRKNGKKIVICASEMTHSVRTNYYYIHQKKGSIFSKRYWVYITLVYKYIFDHKLCSDRSFYKENCYKMT